MSDVGKRNTSDILLSLEEKMTTLLKSIDTLNLNNRLILDRLNSLVKLEQNSITGVKLPAQSVAQSGSVSALVETNIETPKEISKEKATLSRRESINNLIKRTSPNNENITFKEVNNNSPTPVISQGENNKKIPVGQKVKDINNKDIFNASVNIFDDKSKLNVFAGKTNALGKWQAYLPPGTYTVEISKTIDHNTLEKLTVLQNIEVSGNKLQLSDCIFKK